MRSAEFRSTEDMLEIVRQQAARRRRGRRLVALGGGLAVALGLSVTAAAVPADDESSVAVGPSPTPSDPQRQGDVVGRGGGEGREWTLSMDDQDERRCLVLKTSSYSGDACGLSPLPVSWLAASSQRSGHVFGTVDKRATSVAIIFEGHETKVVEPFVGVPPSGTGRPWEYNFFVARIPALLEDMRVVGAVALDAGGAEVGRSCNGGRCRGFPPSPTVAENR